MFSALVLSSSPDWGDLTRSDNFGCSWRTRQHDDPDDTARKRARLSARPFARFRQLGDLSRPHTEHNGVNWLTRRNYGFSDAADLFVFISGYTASFVYARMMLERGFVIGATRLLTRAWQIYMAHHRDADRGQFRRHRVDDRRRLLPLLVEESGQA